MSGRAACLQALADLPHTVMAPTCVCCTSLARGYLATQVCYCLGPLALARGLLYSASCVFASRRVYMAGLLNV